MQPGPAQPLWLGPALVVFHRIILDQRAGGLDITGDPIRSDHLCRSSSIEERISALWPAATLRRSAREEMPRDQSFLGPSVQVGGSRDPGEDS